MTITEIKKIGKGDRYSIYIDGQFSCTLEAEILVKFKLKTFQELEEDEWREIRLENGKLSCFSRSLAYLEKSLRTEKQLRQYLKEKGFLPESIDSAIQKLMEYGFLNDEAFAESYIRSYSHKKGARKLKFELLSKGVASEIVDQKLSELIDEDEEKDRAFFLLKKYLNGKTLDPKLKAKAYAHLASKGFSSDTIVSALGRVKDESWD